MIIAFLEGAALAVPAVLMPGPYAAFLWSETLRSGVRRTLPAAFAPLVTDGLIITLVLAILRQLPPAGLHGLRLAGGVLLMAIAVSFLRHLRRPEPAVTPSVAGGSLLRAVAMNLLNPNPYLFWSMVAGPVLLRLWEGSHAAGVAFVGGFYVTFVGGLVGIILSIGGLVGSHPRVRQSVGWMALLGLFGFAVRELSAALVAPTA